MNGIIELLIWQNELSNSMPQHSKVRGKIKSPKWEVAGMVCNFSTQMTHSTEQLLKVSLWTPAGPTNDLDHSNLFSWPMLVNCEGLEVKDLSVPSPSMKYIYGF